MLGWSLCGHGVGDGSEDDDNEDVDGTNGIDASVPDEVELNDADEMTDVWRALSVEYRMAVGKKCKRLIDEARVHGVQSMGFEAKIFEYVPTKVSPENKLLLLVPEGGLS